MSHATAAVENADELSAVVSIVVSLNRFDDAELCLT